MKIIHCESIDKYFEMKFFLMLNIIENAHIDLIIVHLFLCLRVCSYGELKIIMRYLLFNYWRNLFKVTVDFL